MNCPKDTEAIGDIVFRLGWSQFHNKIDTITGLQNLIVAGEMLPNNVEVQMKLAQAAMQEAPT